MRYRLVFFLLAISTISVVLGITGCLGVSGTAGTDVQPLADVQTLTVEHASCKSCHTYSEETGRAALLENASPDELCASCHPGRKAPGEHRVGMLMDRARMNTILPLVDGFVACISCHEPHGLSGLRKLLRQAPERLCASCHLK
ncbi:hypothetical protein LCGC14_2272260 [marine sediment metagenome]|uniref:Doubled CXXCH motif domain-containing protein n=1 Tax=marine sediment metagenome TaxID=412755 RepID=A0A0F9FRV6_9ZZZZ